MSCLLTKNWIIIVYIVLTVWKVRILLQKYASFVSTTPPRFAYIISKIHKRHATYMYIIKPYLARLAIIVYRPVCCHQKRWRLTGLTVVPMPEQINRGDKTKGIEEHLKTHKLKQIKRSRLIRRTYKRENGNRNQSLFNLCYVLPFRWWVSLTKWRAFIAERVLGWRHHYGQYEPIEATAWRVGYWIEQCDD